MKQRLTPDRNTLLMLIDLQKAIDLPQWGEPNNPGADEQIAILLASWRQRHMPILHVKHMAPDPGSFHHPGQPGNDFKDVALPLAHEKVIEKTVNSAFIGTGLRGWLEGRKTKQIVIAGVTTNASVEATARMSGNLGYDTTVVADACYTFGRCDFNGKWWQAEDVHALSLANLQDDYASICYTRELLQRLPEVS